MNLQPYSIRESLSVCFITTLAILFALICGRVESADLTCYDSVSVNSFDSNGVSDLRCSPSTFALSNRRGGYIQGNFNYVPKGKVVLGTRFSINIKYMFTTCDANIKHTSSLHINDQFIMNLPFDGSQCDCAFKEFFLNPQIASYLNLKPTNTLKITSSISTNSEIFISDVSLKFCYVSESSSISDLKIGSPISNITLLAPDSYLQVLSEPFKNIGTSKMSNSSKVPLLVTNTAVDKVENITLAVSLSGGILISNYLNIGMSLNKFGSNNEPIPLISSVSKKTTSSVFTFELIGVNLQIYETLNVTLFLNSIKEDLITSGVNLEISVSSIGTVELTADNNQVLIPFKLYSTKAYLSENEKSAGPIYNAGFVSDLAYFNFQPLVTSPFNPNCWLQLNMIMYGDTPSFGGNIHIWSSKTKTQSTISFSDTHLIGSTLFMAIPSDQLDCNPATQTVLYMRVETNITFKYRMYVSRKVYSSVSSLSRSVANIFTPKLEQGEAFGVAIDSLYDPNQEGFEKVPLNFDLSSLTAGDSNTRFYAFLTKRTSNPRVLRKRDAVSIPLNQFPNVILDTENLIYYFEVNCKDCSITLSTKIPESIKYPPQLSNSPIVESQNRNDYGIYWKFVDVSSISNSAKFALATLTVNGVQYYSNKNIKLVATQNKIDSSYSTSLRSMEASTDYIQTKDCSNSKLGDYRMALSVPTSSGGVWKFGFYIDPIVMLNNVNFAITQVSAITSISSNAVITVEAFKVPEFIYSFKFDCSSCRVIGKTNVLIFTMLADTLQFNDRNYEIFLKIGDIPTPNSYDLKSRYVSTRVDNTVQTFKPRYIFSSTGTTVVGNDGSTTIVSSKRLDEIGNKINVLIKEVPSTLYSTDTSCLTKNQTASFNLQYDTASSLSSDASSTKLTDNSLISIDATKMIFNDTNIGKNLLVEITSYFSNLNPILIHPVTGAKIQMTKTTFRSSLAISEKYVGAIPITKEVISQVKGATITLQLLPDNSDKSSSGSLYSLFVTSFVEQDYDTVLYFSPLIVSAGVIGGFFVIGIFYMILCYSLTLFVDFHISLKGKLSGSFTYKQWTSYFFLPYILSVFTPLLVFEVFLKKSYTAKMTPKRVLLIGGVTMLILSCIFIVSLLTPMGVFLNGFLYNSIDNIKLKEVTTLGNNTHLACCRYPTSLSYFKPFISQPDGRIMSCISSYSIPITDLTINGVPYITYNNNYQYISKTAINYAKQNCPKSEVLIVNENVANINDIGIAGIVLGLIFLFMGLSQISAPFCKKLVNKIKRGRDKPSSRKASTIASTNASTVAKPTTTTATTTTKPKTTNANTVAKPTTTNHSTANTNSNPRPTTVASTASTTQSNAQAEFQRREEELIRNEIVQLEPQNQPYISEIEMPTIPLPHFKQPSVPSQPIGAYTSMPNDMILENMTPQIPPPNYESPTAIIYDSNIAPAADISSIYNPSSNADDIVVLYQRSNLPPSGYSNNNNFDNPNNV